MNLHSKAKLDPSSVYEKPASVLADSDLTDEEKKEILLRWEFDARELDVAEEENMSGGESSSLDEILAALKTLDKTEGSNHKSPPTKHGGELLA